MGVFYIFSVSLMGSVNRLWTRRVHRTEPVTSQTKIVDRVLKDTSDFVISNLIFLYEKSYTVRHKKRD